MFPSSGKALLNRNILFNWEKIKRVGSKTSKSEMPTRETSPPKMSPTKCRLAKRRQKNLGKMWTQVGILSFICAICRKA